MGIPCRRTPYIAAIDSRDTGHERPVALGLAGMEGMGKRSQPWAERGSSEWSACQASPSLDAAHFKSDRFRERIAQEPIVLFRFQPSLARFGC